MPAEDFRAVVVMERTNDAVDQDVAEQARDRGRPSVVIVDRLETMQGFDANHNPEEATQDQRDHVDHERCASCFHNLSRLRVPLGREHERYSRHDEKQYVGAVVERVADERSTIGVIDGNDLDHHHADLNQQREQPLSPRGLAQNSVGQHESHLAFKGSENRKERRDLTLKILIRQVLGETKIPPVLEGGLCL